MNKRLILILLMLVFSTGFLFATIDMNGNNGFNKPGMLARYPDDEFAESAKSLATGGVFESDIDYLTADKIFNIKKAFFSAGYMPALSGAAGYQGASDIGSLGYDTSDVITEPDPTPNGTMSFFFAVPIKDNMVVGLAAEYQMYSVKSGYASKSAFYGDAGYGKPSDTHATLGSPTDPLYKSDFSIKASDFNIRAVFGVDNLAFHYRVSRAGVVTNYSHNLYDSDEMVASGMRTDDFTEWQHEFGFAYDSGSYKTYVPVGMISKTKATNTVIFNYGETEPTYSYSSSVGNLTKDESWIYAKPEVWIALDYDMLTGVRTGVDMLIGLDFWNLAGYDYFDFDIYVEPILEWSFWEERIDVVIEPILGFMYVYDQIKYSSGDRYHQHFNPYIGASLGTLVRPLEWLELRFGLNYKLDWDSELYTYYGESGKQHSFTSEFNAYTGLGINLGEYFSLDLYVQAGQSYENLVSGTVDDSGALVESTTSTVSPITDLFSINAYGVQFTYRFGGDSLSSGNRAGVEEFE